MTDFKINDKIQEAVPYGRTGTVIMVGKAKLEIIWDKWRCPLTKEYLTFDYRPRQEWVTFKDEKGYFIIQHKLIS